METNQRSAIDLLHQIEQRLRDIEVQLPFSKLILNIEEVSKFTGLSKSTIYKLTCSGGVPHYKQSKHLFFDRDEVQMWLKSNKVKTREEIEKEAISFTTKRKGGVI